MLRLNSFEHTSKAEALFQLYIVQRMKFGGKKDTTHFILLPLVSKIVGLRGQVNHFLENMLSSYNFGKGKNVLPLRVVVLNESTQKTNNFPGSLDSKTSFYINITQNIGQRLLKPIAFYVYLSIPG